MILAQETTCWLGSIDWRVLMVALQLLGLGYLVFAFRSIARNQVQLAEYLKRMLEKDE
jgi:hypothetical protein